MTVRGKPRARNARRSDDVHLPALQQAPANRHPLHPPLAMTRKRRKRRSTSRKSKRTKKARPSAARPSSPTASGRRRKSKAWMFCSSYTRSCAVDTRGHSRFQPQYGLNVSECAAAGFARSQTHKCAVNALLATLSGMSNLSPKTIKSALKRRLESEGTVLSSLPPLTAALPPPTTPGPRPVPPPSTESPRREQIRLQQQAPSLAVTQATGLLNRCGDKLQSLVPPPAPAPPVPAPPPAQPAPAPALVLPPELLLSL